MQLQNCTNFASYKINSLKYSLHRCFRSSCTLTVLVFNISFSFSRCSSRKSRVNFVSTGSSLLDYQICEALKKSTKIFNLDYTHLQILELCSTNIQFHAPEASNMCALVASPFPQFPFPQDNGSRKQDNGSRKPIDTTDNGSSKTIEKLHDPHSYENRLKTFANWENPLVRKEQLAAAGFMFTGHDDIVVCPACKIEGYRWQAGDDPMADHRIWSPNCSFIRSSSIEHDHSESTSRAVDTCGIFGVKVLPNSHPEDQKSSLISELSIPTGKGPHNPDKVTLDSRLASFKNWPRSIKQRPADLAEAGFYYTGAGDQTLCFSCGGGLKDWDEDDDPWEQHAIWFSKCAYLGLKKGKDFIVETKQKLVPPVAVAGSSGIQAAKESEKSISTDNLSDKCEKVKLESDRETKATTDTPLCKICFKNELGVVFLPCGHIVACVDCAAALKTCAVCRKPLEATVRAFLS